MKEYVLELVASKDGYNSKLNIMREYLQAYVLRIMHDEGFFQHTAFLGGTALRFLYQLPRFSEDLDFSSVRHTKPVFVKLMKKIQAELILAGYEVNVSYDEEKTVQSAMVKFKKLMHESGISPHKDQVFSIKIEIDVNPPPGAVLKTYIVNKYFPLTFLSYDINSLFAGKLHALLSRKYVKGRDYFDLGWYLSRWGDISPNIELLINALKQTGYKSEFPALNNWKKFLCGIVEAADWKSVRKDVINFLENPSDMDIFSKENILSLLK
jgi:predicted nucleotidyltransferase component of viral defense system